MTAPEFSLPRLLSHKEAGRLLESFAGLLPGQHAALLDLAGRPAARLCAGGPPGDWAERAGVAILNAGDPGGRTAALDGAVAYPLAPDGQNLGWLVVDTPSAAAEALQATLVLLLKERLDKRQLARETLDRYREVNLLYRLSERFGANMEAGEILQIALSEAQQVIRSGCGIAWLAGPGADVPSGTAAAAFGPPEEARAVADFLRGYAQRRPSMTAANIVSGLDLAGQRLASVLYAPLIVGGGLLGLLALAKGPGQPEFTAGDEKLLLALAGQAAGAVERAELHRNELEHQRIAQELAIGRRIQRSLLPKAMPAVPGWEFAASYKAASQVGGDFYDIFPLPGDSGCLEMRSYGLTIADVTGKGIPAALMMAFSQGILHTAAYTRPEPESVLFHTNQSIIQSTHSGLLLTAFYAVLNPCTGVLTYANAGHEAPLLYRASALPECQELDYGRTLLLGARREFTFQEFQLQLEPGDLLLLYTDGVTEARSPDGDFFSEERLYEVVSQHARRGCTGLLEALDQAIQRFTGGAAQSDDITMLAVRRLL